MIGLLKNLYLQQGIIMYRRIEKIEEENLDWESSLSVRDLKTVDVVEITESTISKQLEMSLNGSVDFIREIFNMKKLTHFLDKNSELSLLFSIVTFPYIVGFCISYFLFYFYGGMPINSFIGLNQNYIAIEMWSIGAYIFITVWVIRTIIAPWAFFYKER